MTLIHNALIVADGATAPFTGWLTFTDDRITAMGAGQPDAATLGTAGETIDAGGAYLLPVP